MCLAYLHLFGSSTKSYQIRHRYDCGKISSKLPNSPLPAFLDISEVAGRKKKLSSQNVHPAEREITLMLLYSKL